MLNADSQFILRDMQAILNLWSRELSLYLQNYCCKKFGDSYCCAWTLVRARKFATKLKKAGEFVLSQTLKKNKCCCYISSFYFHSNFVPIDNHFLKFAVKKYLNYFFAFIGKQLPQMVIFLNLICRSHNIWKRSFLLACFDFSVLWLLPK